MHCSLCYANEFHTKYVSVMFNVEYSDFVIVSNKVRTECINLFNGFLTVCWIIVMIATVMEEKKINKFNKLVSNCIVLNIEVCHPSWLWIFVSESVDLNWMIGKE